MRKPAGKAAARGGGAKTIDDYLAPLPAGQQRAQRTLRRQIRAAAPGVTESISYGIPTFKIDGKAVA